MEDVIVTADLYVKIAVDVHEIFDLVDKAQKHKELNGDIPFTDDLYNCDTVEGATHNLAINKIREKQFSLITFTI